MADRCYYGGTSLFSSLVLKIYGSCWVFFYGLFGFGDNVYLNLACLVSLLYLGDWFMVLEVDLLHCFSSYFSVKCLCVYGFGYPCTYLCYIFAYKKKIRIYYLNGDEVSNLKPELV